MYLKVLGFVSIDLYKREIKKISSRHYSTIKTTLTVQRGVDILNTFSLLHSQDHISEGGKVIMG